MANIKSAKKRILVTEKKTQLNRSKKSEIKTYIKKFEEALSSGNVDVARELLKVIDKKLSKAEHKNIVHKNKVARNMSRLTTKLNKAV